MPTTRERNAADDRKFKFTKGRIDRATHLGAGNQTIYRDTELRGFGLRVTAAGAKSFIAEYRDRGGRKRRVTVAQWGGPLAIDEARDEARKVLYGAVTGADPIEQKRREREGDTLADVAKRYLADLEARAKAGARRGRLSGWASASGLWTRHVPPALKRRRVVEVTVEDVRRPLKRLAEAGHPATSDHVRTVLHAVMETARAEGLRADNPVAAVKPYKRPGKRRRALTLAELETLGEALRTVEATGKLTVPERVKDKETGKRVEKEVEREVAREAAAALRVMALTGMRRSELIGHMSKKRRGPREGLRWGDVDLEGETYRLASVEGGSGGKGGEPRVLPLGTAAAAVLAALRPEDADPDAPVVPSPKKPAQPFVGLDRARKRIYAAAGIADADAHSLRHTFETTAYKVAPAFAGALTGRAFTRDAVLNDYIDPDDPEILAEARKAADAVSDRIAAALDGKLADVLAFEQRGAEGD